MRHRLRLPGLCLVTIGLVMCLSACGSGGGMGSASTNGSGSPTLTFTGNWQITATVTSGTYTSGPLEFGAYLSQSGNAVSGEAVFGPSDTCLANGSFSVSGSLDGNNLSLQSAPFVLNGTTVFNLTINGTVSSTLASFEGNFSAPTLCIGGSAVGTIAGQQVSSFTGNWTGAFQSGVTGNQVQVTASLTEGAIQDSSNFPSLTGNVNVSGTPCFSTGYFGGHQEGPLLPTSVITTSDGAVLVLGSLNSTGGLSLTYSIQGGNCNGDYGTGTLTRQQQ
jgi:hypothetical protein